MSWSEICTKRCWTPTCKIGAPEWFAKMSWDCHLHSMWNDVGSARVTETPGPYQSDVKTRLRGAASHYRLDPRSSYIHALRYQKASVWEWKYHYWVKQEIQSGTYSYLQGTKRPAVTLNISGICIHNRKQIEKKVNVWETKQKENLFEQPEECKFEGFWEHLGLTSVQKTDS